MVEIIDRPEHYEEKRYGNRFQQRLTSVIQILLSESTWSILLNPLKQYRVAESPDESLRLLRQSSFSPAAASRSTCSFDISSIGPTSVHSVARNSSSELIFLFCLFSYTNLARSETWIEIAPSVGKLTPDFRHPQPDSFVGHKLWIFPQVPATWQSRWHCQWPKSQWAARKASFSSPRHLALSSTLYLDVRAVHLYKAQPCRLVVFGWLRDLNTLVSVHLPIYQRLFYHAAISFAQ